MKRNTLTNSPSKDSIFLDKQNKTKIDQNLPTVKKMNKNKFKVQ